MRFKARRIGFLALLLVLVLPVFCGCSRLLPMSEGRTTLPEAAVNVGRHVELVVKGDSLWLSEKQEKVVIQYEALAYPANSGDRERRNYRKKRVLIIPFSKLYRARVATREGATRPDVVEHLLLNDGARLEKRSEWIHSVRPEVVWGKAPAVEDIVPEGQVTRRKPLKSVTFLDPQKCEAIAEGLAEGEAYCAEGTFSPAHVQHHVVLFCCGRNLYAVALPERADKKMWSWAVSGPLYLPAVAADAVIISPLLCVASVVVGPAM